MKPRNLVFAGGSILIAGCFWGLLFAPAEVFMGDVYRIFYIHVPTAWNGLMLLTAAFVRATQTWPARRRVLNISSGLGRRAMAGSAAYCAAKAGMDHFSRAVALDEAQRTNGRGARIVSLAPGVIDTDMQVQLRGADPAGFPEQGNFIKLKENGQLSSAQDAAARVLAYLRRPDFGANPVADVRDA